MNNKMFWKIWGMPFVLAVVIVFGLLAALLGTGFWHLLSWAALTLPLVLILRYAGRTK